jgi:hypothetical protein
LQRMAHEKLRIIGYHHPWPGLGQVDGAGGQFRFVAA